MEVGYHISMCARLPAAAKHNKFCSCPTSYAAHRTQQNSVVSSLGVQFVQQNYALIDRFLEIIKYLRFDLKSEKRQNLLQDKFCLASSLWNPFIENC